MRNRQVPYTELWKPNVNKKPRCIRPGRLGHSGYSFDGSLHPRAHYDRLAGRADGVRGCGAGIDGPLTPAGPAAGVRRLRIAGRPG
jgi:hypothetical protein